MVDRTDMISAILYLVVVSASALLAIVFGANGLSGYVFAAIASVIFLYPAYWAFSIRRAMAVRMYRNQALGIGLVSLGMLAAINENTGYAFAFTLLLVFYWVDASFLSARRSDPLLRDSLHWSKLRFVFWALTLVAVLPAEIYGIVTGNLPGLGSDVLSGLFIAFFFLVPASGIALFAVASRRSGDHMLRRHLAWFGLFALMPTGTILIAVALGGGAGLAYFFGFGLAGFFLYKSARSLVPLNRLSLEREN